jgi:uncharacterized membrane protein
MSLSESINEIKTHIFVAESELNSLIAGKKASASRVRKSLQQIKQLSHALRKSIIQYLQTLPTKKRSLSPKPTEEPAEPIAPVATKPVDPMVVLPKKKTPKKDKKIL